MRTGFLAATALVTCVVACSSASAPSHPEGPLATTFDASASRNGVPRDLLVAIAETEGGLMMPATRTGLAANEAVPAAGPLQLRHGKRDTLALGAQLMSASEMTLREDTDLALEAGARVVSQIGNETGARAEDLSSYEGALEEISGYADDAHRKDYARRVFALLARGGDFPARNAENVHLSAHDLPASLVVAPVQTLGIEADAPDYAPAEWITTSCTDKCTPGRGGFSVEMVVIHDTEGGWDASVATLQNDPGKSVHYIVGQDGKVAQFIHEVDTAWHDGNFNYNERSVGIEHVGYSTQPYTEAQYAASALLVGYLTAKYSVKKDRTHIIGHDQVPNGNVEAEDSPPCEDSPATCESGSTYGGADNHRDPGDWEWCTYMQRFGGECKCNDVTDIYNCSNDHTHAYACKNGTVSVLTCNGPGACVTQPDGVDDICNQAPPAPDGGAGGEDAGQSSGSQPTPTPVLAGDDAGDGTGSTDAPSTNGGGCSAAPSRSAGDASSFAAIFAGFAIALGASRKRARRSSASRRRA